MYIVAFIGLVVITTIICFAIFCARGEMQRSSKQEVETPSLDDIIENSYKQPKFHVLQMSGNERFASPASKNRALKFNFSEENFFSSSQLNPTDGNLVQFPDIASNSFTTLVANPRFLDLPHMCDSYELGSEDTLNNPIQIPRFCSSTSNCDPESGLWIENQGPAER